MFAGMLAVDKWTGNVDGRQAAFWRTNHERKYTAVFIDQGYCFNAEHWTRMAGRSWASSGWVCTESRP